jgi:hypothetical protein
MSIKRHFPSLLLQEKAMPTSSLGTCRKLFDIIFPNDDFSSDKLAKLASAMKNLSEDIAKLSVLVQDKSGGYPLIKTKLTSHNTIYWL